MDKPALRRRIRCARQALSHDYRLDAMRAIARHASRLLKRGKRVGAYLAAGSELDLEILMSVALWRGAEVYLPQIPRRGRRLWFSRLGAADRWYLHPRYRIAEYDGPALRAERLDVLLVPLLAIDDEGYRMGQGGGFYDTTLAFRQRARQFGKPLLVGVAYDCQRVERVPREPWDIRLDYLLTESGLRRLPLSPACR
ncbi:5-formyltetrahydrofolate cyclo-ligase [Chromobacterium sp. LK1]|uniref:5-formyltetrahydrofolate cyclo-ligase n=1 Tax=Chromobacterium sp. LK1 TaxID=1628193 RepID=UPI000653A29C|nr:5-formyltetrahydrofolate cyclo-ligase [Chromobacterium sp. LK1]KMN35322.1 5-formyltetrahydrofolate cyclo-ligase [Chromobacterium sp. LK1]